MSNGQKPKIRKEPRSAYDEAPPELLKEFGAATPELLLKTQLEHAEKWEMAPKPGSAGYVVRRKQ